MNRNKSKLVKVVDSNKIIKLLEKYNINPKKENMWMYTHALTHSSYKNEVSVNYDYEKLEFLGDAALQWVITNYVFSLDKTITEGEMTTYRAGLVCKQSLVRASDVLGLSKLALFGKGITEVTNNMKEDLFEAFLGAIAQDVGIKKVSHLVQEVIIKPYENHDFEIQRHYKTEVQEIFAPQSVKYRLVKNERNDVECEILVDGLVYGFGCGRCQRDAEENAAKDAYEKHCKPIRNNIK